jgi:hypothetical protein
MTPEQLATLKAALLADPALTQFIADYRDDLIRDYYNAPSNPAFVVWRTSVTQDEIMQNGFDWTRVDNLGVGKARIWDWMFDNSATTINPSKLNVRAGIEAVWVGTAADLAVRAAVYVHCKRIANRVERIFATGVGSNDVPGLLTFEGEITTSDVSAMLSGER